MCRPIKYVYPASVGTESRNPAENPKRAKRVMCNAYDYAAHRSWVYRCRYDGEFVTIRRVA